MSSGRLFLTDSFIPGSAASIMMCSVTSLGASSVARADEKAIKAAKAAANTSAMLDMRRIYSSLVTDRPISRRNWTLSTMSCRESRMQKPSKSAEIDRTPHSQPSGR
jgi:hypothetical protein